MDSCVPLSAEARQYLRELRIRLHGLPPTEIEDILREVASHLAECQEATTVALAGLGPADALAESYLAQRECPSVLRRSADGAWLQRAGQNLVRAVWDVAAGVTGYALGLCLLAAAFLKPVFPQRTGLWALPDGDSYSLNLGLDSTPIVGHELLGWWLVPIGVALGVSLLWGATRCVSRLMRDIGRTAFAGCATYQPLRPR